MSALTAAVPPLEPEVIDLLHADPDLEACVPAEQQPLARRALTVPVRRVPPGIVDVGALDLPEGAFSLLVVEGQLTSEVVLQGRSLNELVIRGDTLSPWEPDVTGLDVARRIVARTDTTFAVLEGRFLLAAARWPALMVEIQRRAADQEHRVAAMGAICQLAPVEERIVAMLWHLAGRIGRVVSDGTLVPQRLTHEAIGRLVGARRPTVTLAVKALEAEGRVRRRGDGSWLIVAERPAQD